VKFVNCSYEEFIKTIGHKKVIQFGASSAWQYFWGLFPNIGTDIVNKTSMIVDNSVEKQGHSFEVLNQSIDVKSPDVLSEQSNYVILITAILAHHEAICEQLLGMNLGEDIECYSLYLMTFSTRNVDNSAVDKYFSDRKDKIIPATIHSFWFSGEDKPDLYKRCIESWHKYCPDFKIIEWNTDNYDVSQNAYMLEAFEKRKWAFVSDYARLDVIYRQGGVYLDMDVELTSSLAPYLRADSFFCRQEDGMLDLGSGFGAQKENKLIGEMLDSYRNRRYIMPDGSVDKTAQPELLNPILQKNGFDRKHDSEVVGNSIVLSNDYITCYSGDESVRNAKLGIHWHNGSWLEEKDRNNIKASMDARGALVEKYFNFLNY
jgi:mannosyltransferase OCH1-like enzyme